MKNNANTRKEILNLKDDAFIEYYDKGKKLPYKIKVSTLKNAFLAEAVTEVTSSLSANGTTFLQRMSRTITNAELLALNSSPVELIAAPGEGKIILPYSVILKVNPGETSESSNATQTLTLDFFAVGNSFMTFDTTQLAWGDAEELIVQFQGENNEYFGAINEPLELMADDGDFVEFDGTFDVYITYQIVDLL